MKDKFSINPKRGTSTVCLGEKTITQAKWIAEVLEKDSLSSVLRYCVSETYKRLKKKHQTLKDNTPE